MPSVKAGTRYALSGGPRIGYETFTGSFVGGASRRREKRSDLLSFVPEHPKPNTRHHSSASGRAEALGIDATTHYLYKGKKGRGQNHTGKEDD